LLNRFKDKNPSPLNNLDFLLNHTYVQIVECATQIEEYQGLQRVCAGKLSAALELVVALLSIRFDIGAQETEVLRAHLCTEEATIQALDKTNGENSWEDVTNAQITYMLKNSFGKGAEKAAATSVTTTSSIK
jgi:Bardet-Biedl syndrome 9 protein